MVAEVSLMKLPFRWMPLDLTDDKSTLVQVMAWCRQATCHYLSQCWPRSMLPNGVSRPQWVKHSYRVILHYFVRSEYEKNIYIIHLLISAWNVWNVGIIMINLEPQSWKIITTSLPMLCLICLPPSRSHHKYHLRRAIPCWRNTPCTALSHWGQEKMTATDNIFKCIFLNENVWISNNFSLKFVFEGLINNIPALVQTMAWCRPGNKPLSEPMMVSFLMHICITRPQWLMVHPLRGNTSGHNYGLMVPIFAHRWPLHKSLSSYVAFTSS